MNGITCDTDGLHHLFGGTMSFVLPSNAKDMSSIREIPDHQEVFAHETTDQSLMVDILEYQNHVVKEDAARYHFKDLASSNDAEGESEVSIIERIPSHLISMKQSDEVWFLSGRQMIAKFDEKNTAKNLVHIYLMLFRLPQYSSDILVIMNSPVAISKESSSSQASNSPNSPDAWTLDVFKKIGCSLTLVDPGLFSAD